MYKSQKFKVNIPALNDFIYDRLDKEGYQSTSELYMLPEQDSAKKFIDHTFLDEKFLFLGSKGCRFFIGIKDTTKKSIKLKDFYKLIAKKRSDKKPTKFASDSDMAKMIHEYGICVFTDKEIMDGWSQLATGINSPLYKISTAIKDITKRYEKMSELSKVKRWDNNVTGISMLHNLILNIVNLQDGFFALSGMTFLKYLVLVVLYENKTGKMYTRKDIVNKLIFYKKNRMVFHALGDLKGMGMVERIEGMGKFAHFELTGKGVAYVGQVAARISKNFFN